MASPNTNRTPREWVCRMPNPAMAETISAVEILPHSSRRVFARSSRAFFCRASNVICDASIGWFCQIPFRLSSWGSSCIFPSLVELPGQDVFDPVNPHRHVRRRQSRDFSDGHGVHTLEIGDDDLAVQRL